MDPGAHRVPPVVVAVLHSDQEKLRRTGEQYFSYFVALRAHQYQQFEQSWYVYNHNLYAPLRFCRLYCCTLACAVKSVRIIAGVAILAHVSKDQAFLELVFLLRARHVRRRARPARGVGNTSPHLTPGEFPITTYSPRSPTKGNETD